jgi:type IV pilus assembly protein PilQ
MRIMWRALSLAGLVVAGLVVTNGALPAGEPPVVHVKAVVQNGVVRLQAQANAPFQYTSYRSSENLYMLDLSGVAAADPAGDRVIASDLVKGYREVAYSVGDKPMVRLEILLTQGVEPRLERTDSQELTLLVSLPGDSNAQVPSTAGLKSVATRTSEAKSAPVLQTIQQVTLAQNGGKTEVNVRGSGPLNYHSTRLQNPDRLVLDFESSHLKTSTRQIASNLDPIREIRLAQFAPEVSRVVIDLRAPARYTIGAAGNGVNVTFATGPGVTKSAPAETPSDLVTTKAEQPKAPALEVVASAPIPAPASALPVALTQPSSALADAAPSKNQQPEQQESTPAPQPPIQAASAAAGAASAPQSPDSPQSQPVTQAPAQAPVETPAPAPVEPVVAPQPKAAESQAFGTARYTGEPISVNLKDVDLRDFFRLIHEISGLNVVVDPQVHGTLTIVLDDVPWDQALDIVLHNNDLEKQLDGNVLRIATKETVKKEAEQNRDLAKAQAEAADVVTTTRVLNYAKAADMASTLKKFLSSRGDILADDRSNTLIIRDVPSVLPVIDNLLRQLDRKARQVEIEARVVAANRSFSREWGTQLAAALASGHSTLGGASAVGESPVLHQPAPPFCFGKCSSGTPPTITNGVITNPGTPSSGQLPLLTNLGASAPTSGFSYIFQNGNFALDEIITAAEERGVGKLLSKPKLVTQNNQKATVKQGTKIPVQTIINNTVSVQFVDAVLQLEVTPQITADGTIFMDVTVTNDQIDQSIPRVQGIPAIDTQAAQTRVTVNDGATVVVGGVIVTNQRTDIQQVPVLGSVPVIGNLFKHSTVSSSAQELLFFLTPRILPG